MIELPSEDEGGLIAYQEQQARKVPVLVKFCEAWDGDVNVHGWRVCTTGEWLDFVAAAQKFEAERGFNANEELFYISDTQVVGWYGLEEFMQCFTVKVIEEEERKMLHHLFYPSNKWVPSFSYGTIPSISLFA